MIIHVQWCLQSELRQCSIYLRTVVILWHLSVPESLVGVGRGPMATLRSHEDTQIKFWSSEVTHFGQHVDVHTGVRVDASLLLYTVQYKPWKVYGLSSYTFTTLLRLLSLLTEGSHCAKHFWLLCNCLLTWSNNLTSLTGRTNLLLQVKLLFTLQMV